MRNFLDAAVSGNIASILLQNALCRFRFPDYGFYALTSETSLGRVLAHLVTFRRLDVAGMSPGCRLDVAWMSPGCRLDAAGGVRRQGNMFVLAVSEKVHGMILRDSRVKPALRLVCQTLPMAIHMRRRASLSWNWEKLAVSVIKAKNFFEIPQKIAVESGNIE